MSEYIHLSSEIKLQVSQQEITWKKNKFGNVYTSKVYLLNTSMKVKTSLEKFVHLVLYYKLYISQNNKSLFFDVNGNIIISKCFGLAT